VSSSTTARSATPKAGTAGRPVGVRQLSAQATRDSILRAAIKVFAKHGFNGGSVEKISKAAKSYDRMIYYYFGNKEGLFVAALEEIYRRFNEAESGLDLDLEKPVEALSAVIRFAFRYYEKHPEFIRLLNTENLHRGKHIGKSLRAREYSSPAIGVIDDLLRSGVAKGVFREDVSARDLYLLIAAAGYFYQSNKHTLSSFLGENLEAPAALASWETFVNDIVLRGISASAPASARRTPKSAAARVPLPSID
jgi:TetR/AcrR family transcriptional regulator, upper aerobic nicotinate degradation pathway regulator